MVAVFTVCFEDPFWVGVLESEEDGRLTVARHVFGAEPSNAELRDFMLYRFAFMRRSTQVFAGAARGHSAHYNPKRAQREAMRDAGRPSSTKAQAALSAAQSELKAEREAFSREERRAEAERRFELRSEKRKSRRAGH
jgi:hypothetical protein